MASSVTIEKLADKMKLTNLLPNISMAGKKIVTSEINRPALSLPDILIISTLNVYRLSDM